MTDPSEARQRKGLRGQASSWAVAACLLAAIAGTSAAQNDADAWLPKREEHPWASFLPGSWKVVRIIATDFDSDGGALRRTTTRTETTVSDVSDEECVLSVRTNTTVIDLQQGVEPQEFGSEPTEIVLPLAADSADRSRPTESLTIDGRELPVRVWETRRVSEGKIQTRKVWYRRGEIPAVLKETVRVVAADNPNDVLLEWESRVTTLRVSLRVLDDRLTGWQVKTVRTTPSQTTATTEFHCRDVPGTLISASTSVTDSKGHVLRKSELVLDGYGACYEKGRPARRARRRARRRRDPAPSEAKSKETKAEQRGLATHV